MNVFVMAIAGVSILAVVVLHNYHQLRDDTGDYMSTIGYSGVALVCCALVSSALCRIPGLTEFFDTRWLRVLGKYSYGIYVYHVPVNFAMRAALRRFGIQGPLPMPYAPLVTLVQISIACAVAWLSYTFFESRFLLLKRNFEPQAEPCYR